MPNAFYIACAARHAIKDYKLASSTLLELAPERPVDIPGRNAQHFSCRANKRRLK
jgi:hypothetical protein